MSRNASGSTKAKKTIVATPAAKKLGQSDRPQPLRDRSRRMVEPRLGEVGHCTGFAGALRQRPGISGGQARASLAQQRRCDGITPWRPSTMVLVRLSLLIAIQPVAVSEIRRAQVDVALAGRRHGRQRRRLRTAACRARPCSRSARIRSGLGKAAHIGDHIVLRVLAAHAGQDRAPGAASRLRVRRARSAAPGRANRPSARSCRSGSETR